MEMRLEAVDRRTEEASSWRLLFSSVLQPKASSLNKKSPANLTS